MKKLPLLSFAVLAFTLCSCSSYPLGGQHSETFLGPEKQTGWFFYPHDGKEEANFAELRNPVPFGVYTPREVRRERAFF